MKTARVKNYKKHQMHGITFDSKREALRYLELKFLERSGEISDLRLQVKFPFTLGGVPIAYPPNKLGHKGPQMYYKADFVYLDNRNHKTIIEDSKGHLTDAYKIKRAIMYSMGFSILET